MKIDWIIWLYKLLSVTERVVSDDDDDSKITSEVIAAAYLTENMEIM